MKKLKIFFIISIFSLLLSTTAFAYVKTWTSATAKNTVLSLAIEETEVNGQKKIYVWTATDGAGVVRWDKDDRSYIIYDTRDGLLNNIVQAIAVDHNGTKWFGHVNGVTRFDDSGWKIHTKDDVLAHNNTYSIAVSPLGTVWFGAKEGVTKFDGSNWTTISIEDGLRSKYINTIAFDSNGKIWFGASGGISVYNEPSSTWEYHNKATNQLRYNNVNAIAFDDSAAWIGSGNSTIAAYGGLNRLQNGVWSTYTTDNGLPVNTVNAIAIESNGIKWIGTGGKWEENGGLSKMSTSGSIQTYTYVNEQSGPAGNRVTSIAIDSDNSKWIGTKTGLSRFENNTWTAYKVTGGIIHNVIYDIEIEQGNIMWFGTKGGVSKYKDGEWVNFTKSDGLVENAVMDVQLDIDGSKWFCSREHDNSDGYGFIGGVTHLLESGNSRTWESYSLNEGDIKRFSYSMAVDLIGNKIFAVHYDQWNQHDWGGAGIKILKANGSWEIITNESSNEGLANNYIREVSTDEDGNLWVATISGANSYDGTDWVIYNNENSSGALNNNVETITKDSNGILWFGTRYGATSYDGEEWKKYNHKNGLSHQWVFDIAIDNNGSGFYLVGSSNVENSQSIGNELGYRLYFDSKVIDSTAINNDYAGFIAGDNAHHYAGGAKFAGNSPGIHATYSGDATFG